MADLPGIPPSAAVTGPGEAQPSRENLTGVEPTGRFRIYLGVAAGAGKTVAMLDEGHRRRGRGADVVIAYVDSHGRPVTESYVRDLEVVPRKTVEYHGSRFEEMDLAAVLARRPQVALVDELAHSNVPEPGGHGQRWQDVLAMVEAGIDVVSTVNIQHLASIAGTVERIANVPVRERVPDWVVRRADQIELVDSSPEQLRRRMLHGNIYPAGDVPGALAEFFSVGNLTALRELALRFLAAQTEEELLAYLRRLHGEASRETREHVMAAIAAVPGAAAVLRRAAAPGRLAGRREPAAGGGRGPGRRADRLRPRPAGHQDRGRGQPAQPVAGTDRRRLGGAAAEPARPPGRDRPAHRQPARRGRRPLILRPAWSRPRARGRIAGARSWEGQMSRRVVVDCDTGVDDALALLYLAAEPGTEIIAVGSVHGNVTAQLAAINTLRVLELAGLPGVPVAVGAARPLAQPLITAESVHGHDGLGGVGHPEPRGRPVPGSAAEQLVRLAREQPRGFDLLATGPLTNLALALLLEPELPQLIPRVVVMGGATAAPGNVTPLAEANIWHDPEAAALVLGAPWQVTLVPLDVTDTVLLGAPELARLERDSGPVGRFCWKILQHYLDFHLAEVGRRICPLHDPMAAMLLTHPDLADYEQATVLVECGGGARGATIVDRRPGVSRGGNVAVARQARREAAVDRLMAALTQPG